MNILGKIVVLRALEPDDMEVLRSFHNDPAIADMIGGWSFPISMFEQRQWYERIVTDPRNKRFAIETPKHGFIGISNLTGIDWKYRSAVHGIMIGRKEHQGHGYGRDTLLATMRYAFEELGLERLEADVAEFNEASLRLYSDRFGWVVEGKRRRSIFRRNQWHDSVLLGCLRGDYLRLVEQNGYWVR